MKLSKLSLAAFMLFTFTGCGGGGGIYPQPSDKYPFEVKMKALLGDNLEIVNSIRKAEVQISSFDLPKKNNQIDKVISQLKKDGWILKGHGQGVDTYCLGANNSINIVSPTAIGVYDYQGGKLNITDYNSDAISYSYNKWGEDLCE
ncbi:hypothetical protein J8Z72_14500 [Acinetobacter nosocomialis]|uniref:hypothetical protein n=1 Tax=Acinetobacter nosocomialis TaxID=106654 RepID=UPI000DE771EA|nr:hypothetical protein [Acinetobacter nosocomialis]MBP1479338.1 hypothetical protein [Acinetobacter nosocomialis]MBP1513047.1 hypothetical protein [Acinetobacter nosocomialis]SSV54074.1 Uncharacterised protein [Acinetobacter nosocomialis]HCA5286794.1 hypothetical protein [Acinetobacter nosocomialis]